MEVTLSCRGLALCATIGVFVIYALLQSGDLRDRLHRHAIMSPYDVLTTQRAREAVLERGCRAHRPKHLVRRYLANIIVNDDRRFLYCMVPKVASTNWKRVLAVLSGNVSGEQIGQLERSLGVQRNPSRWVHDKTTYRGLGIRRLHIYNLTQIQYRLNNYFTFMFVRHPLHRLVAAYRDKFTIHDNYTKGFQLNYGRKIIRTYRKNPSNSSLTYGDDVHFDEFIQFIADTQKQSFWKKFNVHWRPCSKVCTPCRLKYDFVGHLETLKADADFVLSQVAPDLAGSASVSFPDATSGPSSQRYGHTTDAVIKNYFRNISAAAVSSIFKAYSLDFELFGYKPLLYDTVHV